MNQKLKPACIRRFQPAVKAVERLMKESPKDMLLVAIEGRCASGKTTLAAYLQEQFDSHVFHMDDFFLRPEQRTRERLAEVGGNVDYERFREEVLLPLQKRQAVNYRKFSCRTGRIESREEVSFCRLNIIEGSYSLHPFFAEPYDLKIFMDIDADSQMKNILIRNGAKQSEDFKRLWIPKEEAYFEKYRVEEGCMKICWGQNTLLPR